MQNASRLSRLEIYGSVPEISAAAKDAPTELRDLRWLGVEALRRPRQWTLMFREFAGSERKPGDKAEVFPGAIFQHVLGISIDQVVPVLDRNNRRDAPDCFDLLYADFRQSDVANLALALKIHQRVDLIFHRDFRVDPVPFYEINSGK